MSNLTDFDRQLIYIAPDLECAYRWSEHDKCLEVADLTWDGVIKCNWALVVEHDIGEETVFFHGKDQAYSKVYRFVEKKLGVKR